MLFLVLGTWVAFCMGVIKSIEISRDRAVKDEEILFMKTLSTLQGILAILITMIYLFT